MVRLPWRRGRDEAAREFESRHERLARLSGEMLRRYQAEINAKISDPGRLEEVYGSDFASAGYRRQAMNICQTAASMLRTPHALVTIVTPDGQESIASYGEAPPAVEVKDSFCKNVIGTGREFAVDNSRIHNLVCDTRFSRDGEIISYLGVPIARAGYIIGVLCVFDVSERHWDIADVSMLTQLAAVLTRATSS